MTENERPDDSPPVGKVDFGSFRRLSPISRSFGFDRGQPIDRYYIERFLDRYRNDVRGHVLEIGDDGYTRAFGGARVTRSDVLSLTASHPTVTIVADLARGDDLPGDRFDCFILTQTLQFIYRLEAAMATVYRLLRPGGVLLATFPVISQICRYDMDRWGDYWRFTSASVQRLVGDTFGPEQTQVESWGNVLAATCFLNGLAAEELMPAELDAHDPDYQVLITARALKTAAGSSPRAG